LGGLRPPFGPLYQKPLDEKPLDSRYQNLLVQGIKTFWFKVSKPFGSRVSKPFGSRYQNLLVQGIKTFWFKVSKPFGSRVSKPLDKILSTSSKKEHIKKLIFLEKA
jgi:hypothetical protein